MVTDTVADFINRLKTASLVGKASISLPSSALKLSIAGVLKERGYITSFEEKGKKVKKTIEVALAYTPEGKARIQGTKRISTPGRRMYTSVKDIAPVRSGKGMMVLSTPQGVLSGEDARKAKVGGEVLFKIW